jgi:Zn-dependent protease with chaperone function
MSSSPESASRLEELEAGLAAIQQGNFTKAILFLEACLNSETDLSQGDSVKARIGLVRAYAQAGRHQDAIALCQTLAQSHHEKVRSWATRMLTEVESPETSTQTNSNLLVDRVVWRHAGRAQRWQPLKPLNPARLQWAEMGTAIALFSLVYGLCAIAASVPYLWFRFSIDILRKSAVIPSASVPIWPLIAILIGLFVASPWILDGLLWIGYGMRSLTTAELARFSPETHRLLQRFCQQHKIPIPKLGLLPTQAPVIFTYGCFPQFARIAVSQGLMDQLAEDEIAAIYASELGHIFHWNFCWMSWVAVVLQIPYTIYQQSAIASDWLRNYATRNNIIAKLLKVGAAFIAILSATSYGMFWVLRWSGLWLSKQRIEYSDRQACNLTGNPNGLARALLKISIATAQTIQTQQKTDELLEGFELLTPIGYRNALTLGSFINRMSLSSLLKWDHVNVDRDWLLLNNSHPLIGERLATLMSYAQSWQLEPELELLDLVPMSPAKTRIFQQGAPFFWSAIGIAIALLFWSLAHIAYRLGYERLNWLASDYKLFFSFAFLGFGLGTILRFNRFFRERGIGNREQGSVSLVDLLTQPDLIPVDSRSLSLEGVLLGRSGTSNNLAQDLTLQTKDGLIKLHFLSQLGVIGNLLNRSHPSHLIGQTVTISGWFRRGATPWMDVATIKASNHPILHSGHQIWSTIVATSSILAGLILIL